MSHQSWHCITDADYKTLTAGKENVRLVELVPEIGRRRNYDVINRHKFWSVFKLLADVFPNDPFYMIDCGLTPNKYVDRVFVQYGTGPAFCFGTYFTEWRIRGERQHQLLISDLCDFIGIPQSWKHEVAR